MAMRYAKGTIQLNQAHDYPLLRQVLRSDFILHRQLFEFLEIGHYECSRQSFAWRARRLLRHGLLRAQNVAIFGGDLVYSVASLAANHLQGTGEACLVSLSRPRPSPVSLLHAVELNEIHLSALRSGLSMYWTYALEVRCQNELTQFHYAKDYDAVIRIGSNGHEARFALEYERTPKAKSYYEEVSRAVAEETAVLCILYLVPGCHMLNYVSRHFSKSAARVCFGLVRDWHAAQLNMPVSKPGSYASHRLQELLA
jgi:hypothetical protein